MRPLILAFLKLRGKVRRRSWQGLVIGDGWVALGPGVERRGIAEGEAKRDGCPEAVRLVGVLGRSGKRSCTGF